MSLHLTAADWLGFFTHFATLSLLAVGGAITTAPDMHRYLVGDKLWLTDAQFTSSIALAQAAPGPNVLFVALMGWNVGMNAGGYGYALLGVAVAMLGILLPSTTLTFTVARVEGLGVLHPNRPVAIIKGRRQVEVLVEALGVGRGARQPGLAQALDQIVVNVVEDAHPHRVDAVGQKADPQRGVDGPGAGQATFEDVAIGDLRPVGLGEAGHGELALGAKARLNLGPGGA